MTKGINPKELSKAIDDIKLAIDGSEFGEVFRYDENDVSKREFNQLNLGLFTRLLTSFSKAYFEKNL